ncbi:MAG: 3-oxoacyl-[acyl-carrier-protein] reductase [Taibaiella sp.]|nr:3-oxoacyl-[acyl-carrier-protein] reductase [Taibaiella sp.]
MKLLENKVALITGGSRGIGEAVAEKLAGEGAQIAFTYVSSEERAQAVVRKLEGYGVKVKAYKSDAGDYAASEQLVNEVLSDFGTVDILVNNAGISRDNLLLRVTPEQWNEVINANLNSVFNLTKQVLKPMMKARKGSIINMSSIVGLQGNAGQASYAASKAGIIGFSKTVARELGSRNIRCNVIAPGFIETDMTDKLQEGQSGNWIQDIPLQRIGKPEDIANAALFLASDLSSYMTGQVMSVCGGLNI